jgi:hypothetical protein
VKPVTIGSARVDSAILPQSSMAAFIVWRLGRRRDAVAAKLNTEEKLVRTIDALVRPGRRFDLKLKFIHSWHGTLSRQLTMESAEQQCSGEQ